MTQLLQKTRIPALRFLLAFFILAAPQAPAADKDLLDVLLENRVITQAQYDRLMQKNSISSRDIFGGGGKQASSSAATADASDSAGELEMVAVSRDAARSSQRYDAPPRLC